MTTALLVVTYHRDLPWIPYLLKSIHRHCTGFSEVVIAIPNRDLHLLNKFGLTKERVVGFDEIIDGHIHHCYIKLTADEYTDCETITFIDSDCVFTSKTTPDMLMCDNKPMLLYTPFEIRDGKEWPSHWRAGAEAALGHPVGVETMRRHGITYRRDTLSRLRDHILKFHGKPLLEYLSPFKRGIFSEFCTAGAFAYYHEPHNYCLVHDSQAPPKTHHQFWSFHGVAHPEVQAKLREFDLL